MDPSRPGRPPENGRPRRPDARRAGRDRAAAASCEADGPRGGTGEEEGRWWSREGWWPASLLAGVAGRGRALAAGVLRPRPPAGVELSAQRLDPLPGGPRHHPLVVGPLRLGVDRVQADPGRERRRRAGLGQPDRRSMGNGSHDSLHPRHRRHHLRQGQRRRASRTWPGMSASQAAAAAGPVDRVLHRPTRRSPRSSPASARSDIAKELALKGPLSLGRPRTLDGHAVDAIDGTQTFGTQVRARRPLCPRPGHPRSGRGGLGERQGSAHRRRAHRLLEVGRDRAARRRRRPPSPSARSAPSDAESRRTPTPAAAPRRGRMCRPPPAQRALDAPPRRRLQESEGHAPHAPHPARTRRGRRRGHRRGRLAAGRARRRRPAPPAPPPTARAPQAEYHAAIKAVGTQGVHFDSIATQNGRHPRRRSATPAATSGAQTLTVKNGNAHRAHERRRGRVDWIREGQRRRPRTT